VVACATQFWLQHKRGHKVQDISQVLFIGFNFFLFILLLLLLLLFLF
jgi:hypothetical protein